MVEAQTFDDASVNEASAQVPAGHLEECGQEVHGEHGWHEENGRREGNGREEKIRRPDTCA